MLFAVGNFTADPSVNLQLLIGGLALGAIYAVVALGFVLVYKSTDVLNLAHGEFLMLGAYFAVTFLVSEGLNFFLGLVAVLAVMLVFGLFIHYGIMRRMVGQGFFAIVLATIGIATVIRALLLIFYGPTERGRLTVLPQGNFEVGGATVRYVDMITLGAVALCVLLFFAFFKYTRMGLHIRAVADDIEAAAAMGIDPDKVYAMTWAAALAMAGLGGLLFGHVTGAIDQNLAAIGRRPPHLHRLAAGQAGDGAHPGVPARPVRPLRVRRRRAPDTGIVLRSPTSLDVVLHPAA